MRKGQMNVNGMNSAVGEETCEKLALLSKVYQQSKAAIIRQLVASAYDQITEEQMRELMERPLPRDLKEVRGEMK